MDFRYLIIRRGIISLKIDLNIKPHINGSFILTGDKNTYNFE